MTEGRGGDHQSQLTLGSFQVLQYYLHISAYKFVDTGDTMVHILDGKD